MAVTEGLKPEKVFYYFEKICGIPHGSGNVGRLSDYLAEFASDRGLYCIQDEWKNIIIVKEAAQGYETEPPIILQGHMDMVAVKKPDADIDMASQGLRLAVEGDYLYAEDTSLGGDDGIAVAYALAILEDEEILHPRLEVIVTVDEETGMDGAKKLDVSGLQGRRMLNLDSEEEGVILAGCAGGARVDWTLPVRREQREGCLFALRIKGLAGGHSGCEIHKERGNANCCLGRTLYELNEVLEIRLAELTGGLADNAIPREAEAVFLIPEEGEELLRRQVGRLEAELRYELQTKDPGVFVELERLPIGCCSCVVGEDSARLIGLLFGAPDGVQAMSADIEGLVETSLNLGIVKLAREAVGMQFSVRSSLESAKGAVIKKLENLARMAGASCQVRGDYPGWAYQKASPFRDLAAEVYRRMYGREPRIEAIHAGLECGILAHKMPGLECISIGPDMKDIHTTEERLSISSVERVWDYVIEILKQKSS